MPLLFPSMPFGPTIAIFPSDLDGRWNRYRIQGMDPANGWVPPHRKGPTVLSIGRLKGEGFLSKGLEPALSPPCTPPSQTPSFSTRFSFPSIRRTKPDWFPFDPRRRSQATRRTCASDDGRARFVARDTRDAEGRGVSSEKERRETEETGRARGSARTRRTRTPRPTDRTCSADDTSNFTPSRVHTCDARQFASRRSIPVLSYVFNVLSRAFARIDDVAHSSARRSSTFVVVVGTAVAKPRSALASSDRDASSRRFGRSASSPCIARCCARSWDRR